MLIELVSIFNFDTINILVGLVLLLNLFYFFIVFKSNRVENKKIYLIHLFSIIMWMFSLMLFRYTKVGNSFIPVMLLYFFPILVPSTFFYLMLRFKSDVFLKGRGILISLNTFFLLSSLVILRPMILGVKSGFSEKIILFNPHLLTYYNISLTSLFSLSFYLMYRIYTSENEEIIKKQIYFLFIGSLLTVLVSFTTNVFLPTFGYFDLNWVGQVSVIFLTSFTFYAILKYKLFDIKIFTSKFVKYLFFSLYGYATFYILTLFYTSSFGSVWSREALTVGVAVAPLFAYVLFRIDKITDAINYFIFGNLNRHQDMLDTILNYVNTNLEDDKIIKFTDEVLSGFLESNGTHLLNLPTTDQKFNKKVEEVFIERREVYLVEEKYLAEKLKNAYCAVRFSTKINNEYIFYVENKRDDAMFSKQDMTLIKGVTNQLEYAIDRSDLYKKTKDYNVELEQKVEERTRELEIQKRTLQSMLEEKEETLHVVSHQIKTPLSVMNSAYEMWRDGLWTADKSGSVIKGELDRMKDTINIFFKAQQTDLRNKEIEFSLNDLNVLLNELVKEKKLNKKIREKQVVLTLDKSFEKLKPFYFDSRNLMEVISNLIDNAISYTKSKVDISLEMKKEKGREYLNIFVKDDGIGVEKEDMERLFERFVRGENAVKTRPDGSGLGLYICKQLMKLMHGRIWVESEGLNKGSTFFISLPYKLELKQKEV